MFAVITTVFYVVGIAFAVEAVMTSRTAQGAIAWSVSLVSFPFVAVPAYLVFGRSKFQGMVEAYEQNQDVIDELVERAQSKVQPFVAPKGPYPDLRQAMSSLTGLDVTVGNNVELLIDGEATFNSILNGIEKAQDYILFQFYIIRDDGLGRRIKDALIRKANSGVRVFFLYDDIGSFNLPRSYINELSTAGVQVSSFKPSQGRRNRFQLNFRNHRKIVVIDGHQAWVGGLNVGDEYLGLDPEFSPWRDTHIRIEGPAAMHLQNIFVGDWYWARRELPELNWQPVASADGDKRVMILPFAPSQKLETAGLFFVAALQAARERIWISAPYFVPDESIMKALELAALRGVDVRIITTGKGDSKAVFMAAFHYMGQLDGLGIRFFAYQPGFLHEKTLLVDDHLSSVGTANFDNRSFRLNFEVNAVIQDRGFAREMEAMFEATLAHSVEMDPASFAEKPFLWRLGVNFSRLLSPVL